MADTPQPNVGDQVAYCRQDWVNRVDEYEARVIAINEDGTLDLQVMNYYGTSHNVKDVRYDETGKPSTWHIPPPGWLPSAVTGGINTQSGFGSESVQAAGVIKT